MNLNLGRNDPCWCGSGKKYKRCHWPQAGAAGAPPRSTPAFVKSADEISGMRRAGRFNGELLDFLRPHVRAGVSTETLDRLAHDYTRDHGHTPACLGYKGYPKSICTSINEVVCHGIPEAGRELREGDIVNVDCTTIVDGFYGDSSETFLIGGVSAEARRLVATTAEALLLGIDAVRPGASLAAVGAAVEPFVAARGFSVVREYTGHGIGRSFHEDYSVFHHRAAESAGLPMVPGMTFTVEPMVNAGDWRTELDARDGWTVYTRDRRWSAQFEHTVLVTAEGAEILTLTPAQASSGRRLIVAGVGEFS